MNLLKPNPIIYLNSIIDIKNPM